MEGVDREFVVISIQPKVHKLEILVLKYLRPTTVKNSVVHVLLDALVFLFAPFHRIYTEPKAIHLQSEFGMNWEHDQEYPHAGSDRRPKTTHSLKKELPTHSGTILSASFC